MVFVLYCGVPAACAKRSMAVDCSLTKTDYQSLERVLEDVGFPPATGRWARLQVWLISESRPRRTGKCRRISGRLLQQAAGEAGAVRTSLRAPYGKSK